MLNLANKRRFAAVALSRACRITTSTLTAFHSSTFTDPEQLDQRSAREPLVFAGSNNVTTGTTIVMDGTLRVNLATGLQDGTDLAVGSAVDAYFAPAVPVGNPIAGAPATGLDVVPEPSSVAIPLAAAALRDAEARLRFPATVGEAGRQLTLGISSPRCNMYSPATKSRWRATAAPLNKAVMNPRTRYILCPPNHGDHPAFILVTGGAGSLSSTPLRAARRRRSRRHLPRQLLYQPEVQRRPTCAGRLNFELLP